MIVSHIHHHDRFNIPNDSISFVNYAYVTSDGIVHIINSDINPSTIITNIKNVKSIGLDMRSHNLIVLHNDGTVLLYDRNTLRELELIYSGVNSIILNYLGTVIFYVFNDIIKCTYSLNLELPKVEDIVSIRHNSIVTRDRVVYIRTSNRNDLKGAQVRDLKRIETNLDIADVLVNNNGTEGIFLMKNGIIMRLSINYNLHPIKRINVRKGNRVGAVDMNRVKRLVDVHMNNTGARIIIKDEEDRYYTYSEGTNSLSPYSSEWDIEE